jgi:DNA-binding GntR family transcriptional regulator
MANKGSTTQAEKAYLALKRAILHGEIEEGSFLSEAEITVRYKVGRTPYREACNRLLHEKLLQVVPHRGYLLPEISFQTVCELFEVRLILEDSVAQLATARATEHDIRELERLVKESFSSKKLKASISEFVEANAKFHLTLAKASKNRRLVELVKQTLENTERLMYIELRSSGARTSDFRTSHEPILTALKRRDVAAVRTAVWKDITEGQSLTLSIGKKHAPASAVAIFTNGLPSEQSIQNRREN